MKLYLVGVIVLVCIAETYAATSQCNDLAKVKLQTKWFTLYNVKLRSNVCQVVFRSLFSRDPAIRRLFSKYNSDDTSSPTFKAHALRVCEGLDMAFSLLQNEDVLKAQLKHLSRFHSKIPNLKLEYFEYMEEAFEEVMSAVLLDNASGRPSVSDFDHAEFRACFNYIVKGLTDRLD